MSSPSSKGRVKKRPPIQPPDHQQRRLEAIQRIVQSSSQAQTAADIYETVLEAILSALPADRASILLLDPDGVMRFKAWRGLSDDYRRQVEGHTPWPPDTHDPEPITVADVRQNDAWTALQPLFAQEGIGALAFIPLTYQGRLLGKFMIYYNRPHLFEPEEIRVAQTVASEIAFALQRQQMEAALYGAADNGRSQESQLAERWHGLMRQQAVVAELGQRALSGSDLDSLLNTAVAMVSDCLGVDACEIIELGHEADSAPQAPGESVLCLPIPGLDQPETYLSVRSHRPRQFTANDNHFLQSVAHIIGTAVARRRAENETRQSRDELHAILRSINEGIVVQGSDGRLIYANETAARMLGFADTASLVATPGDEILQHYEMTDEFGRPFSPEALPGPRALQGEEPRETVIRYRSRETGAEKWSLVNARPLPAGQEGSYGVVNVFHDVTQHIHLLEAEQQARRAAEKTAQHIAGLQVFTAALSQALTLAEVAHIGLEQAVTILDASAGVVATLDAGRSELELQAWQHYSGQVIDSWRRFPLSAAAPLAEAVRRRQVVVTESVEALAASYPQLVGAQYSQYQATISVPLIADDEVMGGLTLSFALARSFSEEERLFCLTLARQLAQACKRARLYQAEQLARAEAEAAKQRLQFLAKASTLLSGSLDYTATLSQVAHLAVPEIADWCIIHLLDDEGYLERVAMAHTDPEKGALLAGLPRRHPTDPQATESLPLVARTGLTKLIPEITPERLAEVFRWRDDEQRRLVQGMGLRSAIVTPLKHRERVFGVLTFVTAESGQQFEAQAVTLVEELAGRAALAIENARLYAEAGKLNEQLEQRVIDRTQELQFANVILEEQVWERARAEESLRQSEERLIEAQRIAHLGNWQWDVVSKQLSWSAELYQVYGVEPGDFGGAYQDFVAYVHPDDQPLVEAAVRQALSDKEPFSFYHRIIRPDGQERLLHGRGQVIVDGAGAITRLVGTGQDVTEIKEAEARLIRYVKQLDALQQVSQAVVGTLDLNLMLQRLFDQVIPLLGAEGAVILLPENEELVCRAATGLIASQLEGRRVPLNTGYAGEVMRTGQPAQIADVSQERRRRGRQYLFHTTAAAENQEYTVKALLAAPLQLQGDTIGVMEVVHSQVNAFSSEDLKLLLAAANWTATAIGNVRQHERLQRRLQESEALAAISRELNETLDLDHILRRIARAAQRIIHPAHVVVIHLSKAGGRRLEAAVVAGWDQLNPANYTLATGEGISGQAFAQGELLRVADLAQDERRQPIEEQMQARAILAVPIGAADAAARHSGVLTALSYTPGVFSADDERLLATLALQAGLAIQNTNLFEALEREKQRLELLYDLSQRLSSSLNLAEVGQRALQLLLAAAGGERGELMLSDAESRRLKLVASLGYGPGEETLIDGREWPLAEGAVGYVAQTRRALVLSDLLQSEAWELWPGLRNPARSAVVVPLMAADELAGILCLMSDHHHFYSDEQLPLLQAAATPVALAIINARLYEAEQEARHVAERLFAEVRDSREQLRRLAEQVVSAQEDERQRISRELHDEAGQALTGLKISLSLVRDEIPAEAETLQQRIEEAINVTGATMEQIRALSHALHPPALSLFGLDPALEYFCRDFGNRTRLPIRYTGCELPVVPGALSSCFYRFLQEALTNVAKHANARHVEVVLDYDGQALCLLVSDDGDGFDSQAVLTGTRQRVGMGLLGMRERFELLGGAMDIEAQPGQGARLVARAPWQER